MMSTIFIILAIFLQSSLSFSTESINPELSKAASETYKTYESFIQWSQKAENVAPVKELGKRIHKLMTEYGEAYWGDESPYPLKTQEAMVGVYDYIIVGAGAAGSVLALRLSENSTKKILVLEAGEHENGFSVVPINAVLQMKYKTDWMFESVPQKYSAMGLEGRRVPLPQGKVVGGSTSHNLMVFVKGNHLDFDRWEQLGAKGWSYRNVFPYFIKAEKRINDSKFDEEYHGQDGPMPVSQMRLSFPVDENSFKALKQFDVKIGDYNGGYQSRYNKMDAHIGDGERFSAARSYLQEASQRSNVDLVTKALVTRITFDDHKRATGVIYEKNNSSYTVIARKEVIISAGPYNTPKLLMLSGIGPRETLTKFKIPIVAESPGVGQNLQDHPYFLLPYTTKPGSSIASYRLVQWLTMMTEYQTNRTGFMATPGLGIYGLFRSSSSSAPDDRPSIGVPIASLYPPNAPVMGYFQNYQDPVIVKYFLPNDLTDGFMFQVVNYRPLSRGNMTLQSANPHDKPLIDPNLLSHEDDIKPLIEGCLFAQKVAKMKPLWDDLEARPFRNTLPGCERYSPNSREFCECSAITLTMTQYHGSGTAKMGSDNDPMAVVDPKLRVKGVSNLRVIDSSIMPEIVTGTTTATTVMIGEKGADIMKGITRIYPKPPSEEREPGSISTSNIEYIHSSMTGFDFNYPNFFGYFPIKKLSQEKTV
ncbi:oxygen-dependent choline dehydrogenase-like [Brevipalpus obovatus]|uniref:oxygen-dependent choline dehydrogenase-like n=1 Tax=Brevipalpus obovatus TaxID=246614 RepID=UPI003D9F4A7F